VSDAAAPDLYRTGEHVRITYGGRTVDGVVLLASPNGRSLMLGFDAMLGGYLGQMPVLFDRGAFYDLIAVSRVDLEREPRA
jgi:hypothetical protein